MSEVPLYPLQPRASLDRILSRDFREGNLRRQESLVRLAKRKTHEVLRKVAILWGVEGRAWDRAHAVLDREPAAEGPVSRHGFYSRGRLLQVLARHLEVAGVPDEEEAALAAHRDDPARLQRLREQVPLALVVATEVVIEEIEPSYGWSAFLSTRVSASCMGVAAQNWTYGNNVW
eukprot:CAMPEP_0180184650 /NCGR_PEP_ID=MMETSP0986-20121125/41940_1 /TAXON_ID=697907 /ORGANISM="non described non described, Strain CCMP2293" /LENGTH=174 /DNA_ID=CAMNT_0022138355 /DNA_START=137 /DNA_END=659 /DNA_ORIENTATION=-